MEPHLLPVYGGPLDGSDRAYDAAGWLVEVTETCAHKYVLRQDGDGSRYWSHYEVVPLTKVRA